MLDTKKKKKKRKRKKKKKKNNQTTKYKHNARHRRSVDKSRQIKGSKYKLKRLVILVLVHLAIENRSHRLEPPP